MCSKGCILKFSRSRWAPNVDGGARMLDSSFFISPKLNRDTPDFVKLKSKLEKIIMFRPCLLDVLCVLEEVMVHTVITKILHLAKMTLLLSRKHINKSRDNF